METDGGGQPAGEQNLAEYEGKIQKGKTLLFFGFTDLPNDRYRNHFSLPDPGVYIMLKRLLKRGGNCLKILTLHFYVKDNDQYCYKTKL